MGSQELSSRRLILPKAIVIRRSKGPVSWTGIRTLPLYPLTKALEFYTFFCKHKREQPKSPRLLERDCSGAIPQSAELSPGQV